MWEAGTEHWAGRPAQADRKFSAIVLQLSSETDKDAMAGLSHSYLTGEIQRSSGLCAQLKVRAYYNYTLLKSFLASQKDLGSIFPSFGGENRRGEAYRLVRPIMECGKSGMDDRMNGIPASLSISRKVA